MVVDVVVVDVVVVDVVVVDVVVVDGVVVDGVVVDKGVGGLREADADVGERSKRRVRAFFVWVGIDVWRECVCGGRGRVERGG